MKSLKKVLAVTLVAATLAPSFVFADKKDYGSAKNVIMMIPDGMSVEALTTARWMTKDKKFVMDDLATGLVKTNNSNTPIADSAPAGTAMATGIKTESPFVGCYPTKGGMPGAIEIEKDREKQPIANVLEGAERSGRSTGIVSTSNIQHATPADFSAHNPDRNNYEDLGEQQVYQGMEVVLGAGSTYLSKESRKDKEDLISEIKNKGYDYFDTLEGMKASKGDKIWGLFEDKSFPYEIDRDKANKPSLAEMTDKALEVLSKNDKGFFLMVEGSEIDWAAHSNDPVALVHEIKAFDDAVKVAKDFADTHKDTVIVIAADHGTGGITFGHRNITKGYDKAPLNEFTNLILSAKISVTKAAEEVKEDKSNVKEVMAKNFGIKDLKEEELNLVKNEKDIVSAMGRIISARSHIAWTTGGHVGGDVGLYSYSTAEGAERLIGTVHNYEIGRYIEDLLDVDLDKLTEELYQPIRKGFEDKGAKVEFKAKGTNDYEAIVTKGDDKIIFPVSKNYAIKNGEKVELGGLTIYSTRSVYVPQEAFELLK
ncbi:alkaline phosphatase [Peptoniphilus sp. SGI.035]|uniref:alkaline phosphatase n=1 Tax=Peptoniphilus sp. SGI.035 TaxID=3420564 RepID=UPI003D064CA1